MKRIDGSGFAGIISHFNEGETTFTTRIPLKRQGTIRDLAMGGKQFNDVFLLCPEGQIANKNAHFPDGPLMKWADGT